MGSAIILFRRNGHCMNLSWTGQGVKGATGMMLHWCRSIRSWRFEFICGKHGGRLGSIHSSSGRGNMKWSLRIASFISALLFLT